MINGLSAWSEERLPQVNRSKLFHGGGFYPGSEPWQRGRFCTTCDLSEPSLPTRRCRVLCQPGCQAQAGTWFFERPSVPRNERYSGALLAGLPKCDFAGISWRHPGLWEAPLAMWKRGRFPLDLTGKMQSITSDTCVHSLSLCVVLRASLRYT